MRFIRIAGHLVNTDHIAAIRLGSKQQGGAAIILSAGPGLSVDQGSCIKLMRWLEEQGEIKADFDNPVTCTRFPPANLPYCVTAEAVAARHA